MVFLTDPYGQCEFSDASGCFSLKNLMKGPLWQVDNISLQPVQPRSVDTSAQVSPIGAQCSWFFVQFEPKINISILSFKIIL